MTTTYNLDLANDLDRLTAFVAGLSCCCQPLMRCSRCQALYGGMRREVTNSAAVLGIIGPPDMDPDEAAANLLALELARLKRELTDALQDCADLLQETICSNILLAHDDSPVVFRAQATLQKAGYVMDEAGCMAKPLPPTE